MKVSECAAWKEIIFYPNSYGIILKWISKYQWLVQIHTYLNLVSAVQISEHNYIKINEDF